MSGRNARWIGLGLVATAGAGVLGLSAMMNPSSAYADNPDIGLVIGGTTRPVPGPEYVYAADKLYLENGPGGVPTYPDITSFYQGTPATDGLGNGLFTPEGAYPLFGDGVQQLYYNYPLDSDGFPSLSTSVGQGAAILESTILADQYNEEGSTVFGYSQSSTLAGVTMQLLENDGVTNTSPYAPQFLLIADPNNPNGGLFERFNGFETTSGQTTVDQLNLPSLGLAFSGATPSDDFTTNVYTLEYDGLADFPRYPLDFLSDLNAFLGIQDLHGTYLNGGVDGSGPTGTDIATATLLPGSEDYGAGNPDSLTNYYMITTLDGKPVTPPLVELLPQPLQDLLGPDLTYLINLGYGDGTLGYSDAPANVPTPFGLFPDVSLSTVLGTLVTDTEKGITAFGNDLSDPAALLASLEPASPGLSFTSFTDLLSALSADAADPAATVTEVVNGISSAASAAYSTLLPLADIANAALTSLPAYDLSLFTDNLSNGDLLDAVGLPLAANTALDTLFVGFGVSIVQDAASQIAADFSGLF